MGHAFECEYCESFHTATDGCEEYERRRKTLKETYGKKKNMDSIFIIQYGPNDITNGGIISVHYDEDDANEALNDITSEPEFADAFVEEWKVK